VIRTASLQLANISPSDNSVLTSDVTVITGEIHTSLDISQFTFKIDDFLVTPEATNTAGTYHFSSSSLPLNIGNNPFTLSLQALGNIQQQVINIRYTPVDEENFPPPTITNINPADGSVLNNQSVRVSAQIESTAGGLTVLVNGATVVSASQGLSSYTLSEVIPFTQESETLTVSIEASDSLQKTTTSVINYIVDQQSPVIIVDKDLSPAPTVSPVSQSPYVISGTVIDRYLSTFLVNDQPITLTPSTEVDHYRFTTHIAVPLGINEPTSVRLSAYDSSGNKAISDYLFNNVATATLAALLPVEDAELVSNGEPINLQVVARVEGLVGDETVRAYSEFIENTVRQTTAITELSIIGTLASGEIEIPINHPKQTLVYELYSASGERLSQKKRSIQINNLSSVELVLTRIEPINNARYIEPNAPIEIYFNREIDINLLSVNVRETLHGKTYINQDLLGTDFVNTKGYTLTTVNHDLETISGKLTLIPGNTGASFSASRYFGFNAELYVDVVYDGESLSRSRFTVRELPTFINGAVFDQFNQPLANIVVELPELGRKTTTNGDGSYAFGYQEPGENIIPGGLHQLAINTGFANPRFGVINTSVSIQRNYGNAIAHQKLQELNSEIPFEQMVSQQTNYLRNDNLILDLTQGRVLFENGRASGNIHVQFLALDHIGAALWPSVTPLWLYGIQPKGLVVEGNVQVEFIVPDLLTGADYLNETVYPYVVLLGYNIEQKIIEPIGVGQVKDGKVSSVGVTQLRSLDFLGYSQTALDKIDTLEQYALGAITLQQLKAALDAQ
jgi:hypothetical protein